MPRPNCCTGFWVRAASPVPSSARCSVLWDRGVWLRCTQRAPVIYGRRGPFAVPVVPGLIGATWRRAGVRGGGAGGGVPVRFGRGDQQRARGGRAAAQTAPMATTSGGTGAAGGAGCVDRAECADQAAAAQCVGLGERRKRGVSGGAGAATQRGHHHGPYVQSPGPAHGARPRRRRDGAYGLRVRREPVFTAATAAAVPL